MPENADEALRQWQAIGQRVKRVRRSVGMSPMMFARELGTSSLNINLIENLSKCDMMLLRDIKVLANEMRWQVLLEHISNQFNVSDEWLLTGVNSDSIEYIDKDNPYETEHEIVITVPLMIGQSTLLEGVRMIVNNSHSAPYGKNENSMNDAWLYHMLADIFRLYFQEMSTMGRPDIAQETIEAMLNTMKLHSSYSGSIYSASENAKLGKV